MNEIKVKNFGGYLKELRSKANLTQEELAEKVNVRVENVKRWEKELEYPELTEMYKLSEVYQVSCEDLLKYKEEALSSSRKIIKGMNNFFGVTFITGKIIFYIVLFIALISAFLFLKYNGDMTTKREDKPIDITEYI